MSENRKKDSISEIDANGGIVPLLAGHRHDAIPLIIAAVVLAGIVAAPSFWAFERIKNAAIIRRQSHVAVHQADVLLLDISNAETSHRGYILTGDKAFLSPYISLRDSINGRIDDLRKTTFNTKSIAHLDTASILAGVKFGDMEKTALMSESLGSAARIQLAFNSASERMTESIQAEMSFFIQIEQAEFNGHDAAFQSDLHTLFVIIILSSLASLIYLLVLANFLFRQSGQLVKNIVHLETEDLLKNQETINAELEKANHTLVEKEENLSVTLNSIGDAVIVTDEKTCIIRLNPIAERLTGWTFDESKGRPVDEIFNIINQESRQKATIPVMETLTHGTIQGLANHTILIARDETEYCISDSCAPIHNRDGKVIGAVLVFRDVTKAYAIEQTLHNNAVLIQTILDTVVDGIITIHAQDGIIETVNSGAERMFGYTAGELVGQNLSVLIPELDTAHHTGSLDYYAANDTDKKNGYGREVGGLCKDGSSLPLEITVSELVMGKERYFTGILRDISMRKLAEENIAKAGALQKAIFNSVNFSSIATDAKGVIQIFNVGAEKMLGYSAGEVLNKITPADISDPAEIITRAKTLSAELDTLITPGFEALSFKASRGIEDIYELTYIRKDGTRFPAVVSVTALRDSHAEIIGFLLIGTDNTARGIIEADRLLFDQALQDKNDELQIARFVAEKANLAKSDFLSSMSHELRTPLSAILGFAQLLESGTPTPTPGQKRSIDQILKAGWYLLELINEILDLALIESGKLSLSLEPVSLAEVLQECKMMVEPQAQKRNIIITFSQLDAHFVVYADRTRLKQIIINLLSNAIKYNRVNGSVSVECTSAATNAVHISIRDTGEGLAPDKMAQLFEPFNRLGKEMIVEEGTGIGLVVCKRLIELMGGVISVESTVGEGSIFRIEMSLFDEINKTAFPSEASGSPAAPITEETQTRTLLYVEDNPANLMLVQDLIARRNNIRLISATDGVSGIELARSILPNVILMDINLPGISGLDALRLLTKDPLTMHIPVVAISANAIPRDIERGLEAGFFRYLTKPIRVNEFMDTLDLAMDFAGRTK